MENLLKQAETDLCRASSIIKLASLADSEDFAFEIDQSFQLAYELIEGIRERITETLIQIHIEKAEDV